MTSLSFWQIRTRRRRQRRRRPIRCVNLWRHRTKTCCKHKHQRHRPKRRLRPYPTYARVCVPKMETRSRANPEPNRARPHQASGTHLLEHFIYSTRCTVKVWVITNATIFAWLCAHLRMHYIQIAGVKLLTNAAAESKSERARTKPKPLGAESRRPSARADSTGPTQQRQSGERRASFTTISIRHAAASTEWRCRRHRRRLLRHSALCAGVAVAMRRIYCAAQV